MENFTIKTASSNIEKELENIGFDKTYIKQGKEKYYYKNFKIFDLTIPQANILKQTAISVGADCAVHRETITCKIEKTDCVLGGSLSQLRKIAKKLKKQPFKLLELANIIENKLNLKLSPLNIKNTKFEFERPYLVGILNVTPDSFSDGGQFLDFELANAHLMQLIEDGADIIDIGAESTKPFSNAVDADTQLKRLLPILDFVKQNNVQIPISIDTRLSTVAKACIEHGANIINDVSGFDFDPLMVKTIANSNVPVIIQHSKGSPETMQVNPVYENLVDEIYLSLKDKISMAISNGIRQEQIIIDPGIGFGKTKEQNFEIINHIEEFASLGCPLFIGISRKSLLDMQNSTNEEKDIYTLAINAEIISKKVNFIRVHNVKIHKKLLDIKGF